MREQRLAWAVVFALTVLGCTAIAARIQAMRKARLDWGESVWRLTYDIALVAGKPGGRLCMALPCDTQNARVIREEFTRPGLWLDIVRNERTQGREAVAITRSSQPIRLVAEFDVHVRSQSPWPRDPASKKMSARVRASYLRAERKIQTADPAVQHVLNRLTGRKAHKSHLVNQVFDYCAEVIARSDARGPSEAATVLAEGSATVEGRARAMVALCRAAGLPARLVVGFVLHRREAATPHVWVEVYTKKEQGWRPYDPERGYSGELPASHLPVRRGGVEIVRFENIDDTQVRFSVRQMQPFAAHLGGGRGGAVTILHLTRLPYGMQQTLAILLLLPLGALITSVFRNLIGIQTFGTFTPSLLALSFVYADWQTGIVVLVVVMTLGLLGRVLLERMKLLMVPRLSVILTLVVLLLAMAVSSLDYLRMMPSARAVLLPMVILTMMIERFHISAEEDSPWFALKLLTGTVVAALGCFVLLRWHALGRLALMFPEGQLIVAAVLIVIGRHTGYRLTELARFRDVVFPNSGRKRP